MANDKPNVSVEMQQFPGVTDDRKRAMLLALEKQLGIITSAARVVGINRDTHYDWMKRDEHYAKAVKLITELSLDFVESKLFELIKGVTVQIPNKLPGQPPVIFTREPNVAATIFYLKTKGKHRGYIERLQLDDITNEDDMNTTLDV